RMKAIKDFVAVALRDDEWVFTGQPFTDSLWIGADENERTGDIAESDKFSIKGFGYFNKDSKDSFVAFSQTILQKFYRSRCIRGILCCITTGMAIPGPAIPWKEALLYLRALCFIKNTLT